MYDVCAWGEMRRSPDAKGVPSLYMIETVDSVKLANKLNNAVGDAER